MASDLKWIIERSVLQIHAEQIAQHGGASGLRDPGLLSSALARPRHLNSFQQEVSIATAGSADNNELSINRSMGPWGAIHFQG